MQTVKSLVLMHLYLFVISVATAVIAKITNSEANFYFIFVIFYMFYSFIAFFHTFRAQFNFVLCYFTINSLIIFFMIYNLFKYYKISRS